MVTRGALLFPGQGSQYVGMGKDLAERFPEARRVYERADAALGPLGLSVSVLSFEGTETPPKQVRQAQPAMVPPLVRPRSWTDTLFDNALFVMAGILLVMVVGLVYWTWGRRPASDAVKAPPPVA